MLVTHLHQAQSPLDTSLVSLLSLTTQSTI